MKGKGQVWIETVLYTLIGLALIAIALGIVTPRINESRDKIVVQQSVNMMEAIDNKIWDAIKNGAGNERKVSFTMKKGEFYINSSENTIVLVLDEMSTKYSEIGSPIDYGRIRVMTAEGKKNYVISLMLNYTNANITYDGTKQIHKISAAPTPYTLTIENKGLNESLWVINLKEISS